MESPKVSVIMPVFNAEKFLSSAIQSIISQTFSDFEFLIGDDGSTDDSINIISSFRDKRIILIRNKKNEGVANTLNKLVKASKGKYIAVQHGDDIALPDRIEKQFQFLEKNPGIGLCGSNASVFGTKKRKIFYPLNDDDIKAFMIFNNPFTHPSVMLKNSLLGNDGLLYDQNFFPAEDYDMWFRISLKTKLANISERLIQYRWHENNASQLKENILIEKAKEIRKNILLTTLSYKITDQETHVLNISSTSRLDNFSDLKLFEKLLLKLLKNNNLTGYYEKKVLQKLFFHYWTSNCFKTKNIHILKKVQVYIGSDLFSLNRLFHLFSTRNIRSLLAN